MKPALISDQIKDRHHAIRGIGSGLVPLLFFIFASLGCPGGHRPPVPPVTPPPTVICNNNNACEPQRGETKENCADCKIIVEPPPPPEPPPAPAVQKLSISNFHGLTTRQYYVGSKVLDYDWLAWLDYLGRKGIRRTRAFCELPWYSIKFEHAFSLMPYVPLGSSSWDFDSTNRVNPEYRTRIEDGGKIARKYNMEILLCLATQGPDFGVPWFTKMGYGSQSKDYYGNSAFGNATAWRRFQQYHGDIAKMTVPYKDVYVFWEPFNEYDDWGSLVDELKAMRKVMNAAGRPDWQIQMNQPSPIYDPEPMDPKWIARLRSGTTLGFNAARFAFHGTFTPAGLQQLAAECKQAGLPTSVVEVSTDGTTIAKQNGKFIFTEMSHGGHYKWRPLWDDSSANIQATIDGHSEWLKTCISLGFAWCDIQDVGVKWSPRVFDDPVVQSFHDSLIKVARKQ